jgi:hypothetical protein
MPPLSLQRIAQPDDSTCGPTVLQMLLSFYNIDVSLDEMVQATGAQETIAESGTGIDQLSLAISSIAPGYVLLYKEEATIEDIAMLVHEYELPVAVDWQGMFYDTLEEEAKLSSHLFHGHYSIVTDIDSGNGTLNIVDPFYDFISQDRIFPIDWFKTRWWDVDDAKDETGKEVSYYAIRYLFVVIPKSRSFPKEIGLTEVANNYRQQKITKASRSITVHPPLFPSNRRKLAWERVLRGAKILIGRDKPTLAQ